MIVCLGWGSLVWDPRNLPLQGPWRDDGPLIKVDFLRHSNGDRVTLVLDNSAPPVTSLWNVIPVENWEVAKHHLVIREGVEKIPHMISHWPVGAEDPPNILGLSAWADDRGVTDVLWTSLPPRWAKKDGRCPTIDEVITFLSELSGERRTKAEEYIRRAPVQIATPMRLAIETRLGWPPLLTDDPDQRCRI
jgi:hypothetical protein